MSQQNKPILSCRHIGKTFASFVTLKDVTFNLQLGDKVGLVGPNGTGKSTLLKIIAGIIESDSGVLEFGKNITIGYIPQSFNSFANETVLDFLSKAADKSKDQVLIESKKYIKDLHLDVEIVYRPIAKLSGGEKTKIAVVRILLSDYDLFLLDEPTNNLDTDALILLEDFVKNSDKTFIVVSHDRMFLDTVVHKIIDIDEFTKETRIYNGNFSDYLQQKESNIERQWNEYEDASEKRSKVEKTIAEKLAKATAIGKSKSRDNDKMAKNFKTEMGQRIMQRGARLLKDKLSAMDPLEKPKTLRPLKVRFDMEERSGDKVIEIKEVYKTLPNKILGPIDLKVQYGDRILLLGKNGTGKSTILKMILRETSPDRGDVIFGSRVIIGYLPQEENFSDSMTVLQLVKQEIGVEESDARKTLNRFRINEDDLSKKMSELSSGERSRLLLAIMMTKKPNCIILDEPSNHLDLEVLTELESALDDYKGTLIIVSHDRYFIEKFKFNKFFMLTDRLQSLLNYQEYQNR